jgi:hypothetical protein
MKFLQGAVYEKPTFEKKAEYELPKDISDWNEDILKNFFTELPFIPRDAGVDVVINNVDENKGYAKGSVVVFYKTRKINFPIIVKDFKMFPFDIFVAEVEGKQTFMNATERNIKSYLMTNEIGEIKNMYDYAYSQNLKTPGGVNPKPSVPLDQAYHDFVVQDQAQMNLRKLSCLKLASKEQLEKLAIQLEAEPNIMNSFTETTGDLYNQVVDLVKEKREIMKEKDQGKIDLNHVLKAKQTLVALDSEMFDVNNLVPIQTPAVCELRMYEYPSMEDFMESGQSAVGRLQASKVGKPLDGVVVSYKTIEDCNSNCPTACCESSPGPDASEAEKKKAMRERNDQIFISADGQFYSTRRDYSKTGVLFYGTKQMNTPGLLGKVIKGMESRNINDFYRFQQDNHNDGADKLFNPIWLANEGTRKGRYGNQEGRYQDGIGNPEKGYYENNGIFVLFGASDMWECIEVNGISKVWTVEGRKVYMSDSIALIPSNVVSVQKVNSVDILNTPMYKMTLGKISNIYLIPESSVILGKRLMKCLSDSDIMEPSKPIKAKWDEQALSKISVYLGDEGYRIVGSPIEPLRKIAGFNELGTNEALAALKVMGVSFDRGREILKTALDRSQVTVYGVAEDYLNENAFVDIEKTAERKAIFKRIADILRTDTVKIASAIEDQEAVDVVLSLNFINEENLQEYIDMLPMMKKIVTKLASMLVASRMGLTDIEEGAAKKAIDGLEKVIDGLENVKMAIGK